ncbi:MAG: hypothetical protein P8046_15005 [Anaerolineales bacterium]
MGEDIRVTVIATGFDRAGVPHRIVPRQRTTQTPSQAQQPGQAKSASSAAQERSNTRELEPASFNLEDLDIPTFLRKRVGK